MNASVLTPLAVPIATSDRARAIASGWLFMNAPLPHFTSSTSALLPSASFWLITDEEIYRIVGHVARQGKPSYELEIHQALQKAPSSMGAGFEQESGTDEDESLIEQCIEVIRSEQKASVSLLQRRLKLGYGRAARIMDELENRGIVGPSKGAEPRDILIDLDGGGADGKGVETGTMS